MTISATFAIFGILELDYIRNSRGGRKSDDPCVSAIIADVALVDQDQEHLRLLTIFYYAYAAIVALFACFPFIHLAIGILLLTNPGLFGEGKNAPPAFIGYLFTILGAALILIGLAFAFCSFLVARFLGRRKHYLFCLIVSGANCLYVPFGTALGVFTLVVLLRPTVKAMFIETPPLPTEGAVPQSGL
jgi:hypothetical protein